MKLLPAFTPATRLVVYAGGLLKIPETHRWVAADSSGSVASYSHKPALNGTVGWTAQFGNYEYVGEVDLEGTPWQETLVEYPHA